MAISSCPGTAASSCSTPTRVLGRCRSRPQQARAPAQGHGSERGVLSNPAAWLLSIMLSSHALLLERQQRLSRIVVLLACVLKGMDEGADT